jgi:large subunit ribosomal protein L9
MKVILNKDLAPLGEEGDVKEVAKGYARNFLFPRGIAMPYTDRTVALLESRREAIEARKEEKRRDALGIKEKLEELDLVIAMPAGANGRLYGAVTGQTVADELARQGFAIERKRIELPGNSFKSVGKYKVAVKLYESAAAEVSVTVEGQQLKVETPSTPARRDRRRRDADAAVISPGAEAAAVPDTIAGAEAAASDAGTGPDTDAAAGSDTLAGAEAAASDAGTGSGADAAAGSDTDAAGDAGTDPGPGDDAPEPVREESAVEP